MSSSKAIGMLSLESFSEPALALACSPRLGGNSDTLAKAFAAGFQGELGEHLVGDRGASSAPLIRVKHLRAYHVKPCMACYACDVDRATKKYKVCPLGQGPNADGAEQLFHMLMHSPALYLSAPIFFYHLPAQLKAFVDRGQSYWLRRMAGDAELSSLAPRPAWVSLVAARKRGDKLFEGSLVTLRFFLQIFNFVMQEPETLLGYDEADAVLRDDAMMKQSVVYGQRAAQSLLTNTWRRS